MLGTDSIRDPKLLIVDDVVDPGRTSRWYQNSYTGVPTRGVTSRSPLVGAPGERHLVTIRSPYGIPAHPLFPSRHRLTQLSC